MKNLFLFLAPLLVSLASLGQNVGIGTDSPHPSAALEITDSSRGILIPRMTMAQRNAIQNPAEGLMVYQTDSTKGYWYWDGTTWQNFTLNNSNNIISNTNLSVQNYSKSGSGQFDYLIDSVILSPNHFSEINFTISSSGAWGYRSASFGISNTNGDYFSSNAPLETYTYNGSSISTQGTAIFKNQSTLLKKYYVWISSNSTVTYSNNWQLVIKSY